MKTAGTTWLEELIGLAAAGGEGLAIAKEVYTTALVRMDELCGPYATVIDIDRKKLPTPAEVGKWDGERFAAALRHDPSCPQYNPNLRQLLHVGYKVAAEMGPRFLNALEQYEPIDRRERHREPLRPAHPPAVRGREGIGPIGPMGQMGPSPRHQNSTSAAKAVKPAPKEMSRAFSPGRGRASRRTLLRTNITDGEDMLP